MVRKSAFSISVLMASTSFAFAECANGTIFDEYLTCSQSHVAKPLETPFSDCIALMKEANEEFARRQAEANKPKNPLEGILNDSPQPPSTGDVSICLPKAEAPLLG